ncbi:MAG: hypothetical protein JWM68_5169 [Verrucomicrobiales bacterium]|nr:hypothetical protein [Verrucomicrobiales bacterium]
MKLVNVTAKFWPFIIDNDDYLAVGFLQDRFHCLPMKDAPGLWSGMLANHQKPDVLIKSRFKDLLRGKSFENEYVKVNSIFCKFAYASVNRFFVSSWRSFSSFATSARAVFKKSKAISMTCSNVILE